MGRTFTLFTYKLRFFFGPALRGRFGPLAYLGLVLIFLPSGFAFGVTLGTTVRGADTTTAIGVLAAPLAGLLSFGLLYALGAGVTAHVSEFDFFLTAESMKLLAKAGEFVTMKGIPQLLPDADKIQPVEMDDLDTKGYANKREEFRKAFFK